MTTAALRDEHRKAADAARQAGQPKQAEAALQLWRVVNARCKQIEAEFRALTGAGFSKKAQP